MFCRLIKVFFGILALLALLGFILFHLDFDIATFLSVFFILFSVVYFHAVCCSLSSPSRNVICFHLLYFPYCRSCTDLPVAAKQAAFEEANKIRNQFRALDDDEVEFLDEVVAAKRKEEERVRRETEDGVKSFRERQRRTSGEGVVEEDKEEDWGVGRKRKRRDKDKEKGVVKKKVDDRVHTVEIEKSPEKEEPAVKVPEKKSALVDYGSDSDE